MIKKFSAKIWNNLKLLRIACLGLFFVCALLLINNYRENAFDKAYADAIQSSSLGMGRMAYLTESIHVNASMNDLENGFEYLIRVTTMLEFCLFRDDFPFRGGSEEEWWITYDYLSALENRIKNILDKNEISEEDKEVLKEAERMLMPKLINGVRVTNAETILEKCTEEDLISTTSLLRGMN